MAASGKTGGYNCEFIDVVPADFLCESCGLAAREPSLTVCCGKHYCHTCISHLLRDSKPCPGCEAVPFSAILDKNYQRKVLALRVHCTMKDHGCQWTGKLEQLNAHLDVETGDCEYVDMECPEKCGQQIQKCQLAAHLNTCHSEVVECDFSYAGCNKKLQRQDMEKHVEESTREHLALMAAANVRMSREFEQKLQEQRDEFRGCLEKKEERETAEQLQQSVRNLQESFQKQLIQVQDRMTQEFDKKLQEQRDEFQGYLEQKERETAEQLKQKDKVIKAVEEQLARQTEQFQKSLRETQTALQVKLQQLEAEQREQTHQTNQSLEREVQQLQKRLDELETKQDRQTQAVDTKITAIQRQTQEKTTQIEKRVHDCENYIFPPIIIDNFRAWFRSSAATDRSQCMYTHTGGYRFYFVVYENGDGEGRGTHVSVHFFPSKGPTDSSLRWPAKCTITLQLLNQHRDQDHVTVTKELEWKQPTDGPEPIIFSNKFIAHNDLKWNAEKQTQYLKDGRLCFRIAQVKT